MMWRSRSRGDSSYSRSGRRLLLLHGRQDRFVPFTHGEWLARHIPSVEARLLPEDGHLTLTDNHLEGLHQWLLERLQ